MTQAVETLGRPAPVRGRGAMRQRLRRHVVIMDEPTAALGVKEATWCWS